MSIIGQIDVYYRLYKIRYKLQNLVLLCPYLLLFHGLRVFESFNLLSVGFALKGLSVKIVSFLSSVIIIIL